MLLRERIFNHQIILLSAVFIAVLVLSICIKNRPILLKSLTLAHARKMHFKYVYNNIKDQVITVLFWLSIVLQLIFLSLYLFEANKFSILITLIYISLILGKRASFFLSEKIFQTPSLIKTHLVSFIVMVIHIGWLTIPILLIKIIHFKSLSITSVKSINAVFFLVIFIYMLLRLINFIWLNRKVKVSFLHIIFYLCTLEILPLGIISCFLIS